MKRTIELTRDEERAIVGALVGRFEMYLSEAWGLILNGAEEAELEASLILDKADVVLQSLFHFDLDMYAECEKRFMKTNEMYFRRWKRPVAGCAS